MIKVLGSYLLLSGLGQGQPVGWANSKFLELVYPIWEQSEVTFVGFQIHCVSSHFQGFYSVE